MGRYRWRKLGFGQARAAEVFTGLVTCTCVGRYRYAGAGLFDSVHSVAPVAEPVDYTTDRLFSDEAFRQTVMGRVAIAAALVEHAFGVAQDIEGVVTATGDVAIVQTRPQV